MKQILGIHVGTEAIGWSLVRQSTSPRILSIGTRMFSSFVDYLGEGERELSNATARTQIRNARKVYLRKTQRKRAMLSFLAKNGLCPLTDKELVKWRNENKQTTLSKKMHQWFALNPYVLRAKGSQEKLSEHELGRVLYHLTQRRGKVLTNDDSTSKAKILQKGLPVANRLGIQHTQSFLKKQSLGSYLHSLLPQDGTPYHYGNHRLRNRYLTREMYQSEVETVLSVQKSHHKMITAEFKRILHGEEGNKGLLFYERPAQYKKLRGSASACMFEKEKKVMWKSHPLSEWYDIYCWLDSIRLYGKRLNHKQRESAKRVAVHFSSFMFKKVRIALNIDDLQAFNYEDTEKTTLAHTVTLLSRKTAFGQKFFRFSDEDQHELWHDLHFYNDKKMLNERLKVKWGLSSIKAKTVSDLKLKPGYGNVSMKAARTILRYLKEGYEANVAFIVGGVWSAIGEQRWSQIDKETREAIDYFVEAAIKENKIQDPDWLCDFSNAFGIVLRPEKLYLIEQRRQEDTFPISPEENKEIMRKFKPVAQKPIFELRKLVNQLIREYGAIDQVNFVLSNELKANAKQRKVMYVSKKIRHKELPKIHDAVVATGNNPTHTNLFKYKLWLEWNKTCPYTSAPISIEELFTDEVSVVYIHPWKRFFNDSDKNKAICMTYFKENIMDKTPYEYFSKQPSGVWERVKTRVFQQLQNGSGKHNSYQKFRHFVLATYPQDSLIQEFNDQHHIAFKVKNYLNRISPNVVAARGNAISSLRRKWGISTPSSFHNKRRYLDSREPALLALVTAINEPKYLNELRYWNRYESSQHRDVFPIPWTHFTRDALEAYATVSVSIDVNNQVVRKMPYAKPESYSLSPKGKLHKDSYFGKRKIPGEVEESFHIRKPINSLTTAKQVSKIVDHNIRELVYDQIDLSGGFINGKIPKNALISTTDTGWETKVFLPNKRGDNVPVRKVRMRENVGHAVQLNEGKNKYVNPRNNHHVMVYQAIDNTYQEEVVTFWEAVRRIRNKEPLYQLPSDGRMVITTLHSNDCFILGLNHKEIFRRLQEGESLWENVYKVQRLSSKYYEFRQVYDMDTYNQNYPSYIRILNFGNKKTGWLTNDPFKISISLLGDISPYYKSLKVPEMQ